MLRRQIFAAAAALPVAAIASRAFAQDAAATAAAGQMGEAETTHAQQTSMVGALSLMQSRLALQNAENDQVQAFAQFEVTEQETIADILMSMQSGTTEVSGEVMAPADEDLMAMIDEAGQAKLTELQGLSGAEFDAAYVQANLEGHQQLLAIQEEYLASGTMREHVNVAKLARGMITEHIAHLEALQGAMG
jgi:putative membrane protein